MCTILTNTETNKQTRAQAYAIENFIFNLCSLILIFFLNDYPFTLSYYLTVQCSKYLPLYPFFFLFFCHFVRSVLSAHFHGWAVRGSNLGRGKQFFSSPKPSRSALRPPQAPIQWISGFAPERKAAGA
jgi:hypothetical protein